MERIRIADLTVDPRRRAVQREGRWYPLTERSLAALLVLIDAAGGEVSFRELMDAAWAGAVVSEDTVKKRMSLLRQELGDADAAIVQSVRGCGYRLGAPAQRVRRFDPRWLGGIATAASLAMAAGLGMALAPTAGPGAELCGTEPASLMARRSLDADEGMEHVEIEVLREVDRELGSVEVTEREMTGTFERVVTCGDGKVLIEERIS